MNGWTSISVLIARSRSFGSYTNSWFDHSKIIGGRIISTGCSLSYRNQGFICVTKNANFWSLTWWIFLSLSVTKWDLWPIKAGFDNKVSTAPGVNFVFSADLFKHVAGYRVSRHYTKNIYWIYLIRLKLILNSKNTANKF